MHTLRYLVEEAWTGLWRGRRSAAFSIVTIAAALFVLGMFLLVTTNLEALVEGWREAAELSVYLADEATDAERQAVERVLAGSPAVATRRYVSKADALARFQRDFRSLAPVAAGFGDNPFPASFEVRVRTETGQQPELDRLATRLGQMAGVADVRYDRTWIQRLALAVQLSRVVTFVVAAILVVAGALTVANVVRLACYARREELEIMHLVGAPSLHVRGPFVGEGILQGGLGALVALALLWAAFVGLQTTYGPAITDALGLSRLVFLPLTLCGWLLGGGMAVGCAGALMGARVTIPREV